MRTLPTHITGCELVHRVLKVAHSQAMLRTKVSDLAIVSGSGNLHKSLSTPFQFSESSPLICRLTIGCFGVEVFTESAHAACNELSDLVQQK